MADKSSGGRWTRYRPPGEPRDEPSEPATAKPKQKSKPKPKQTPKSTKSGSSKPRTSRLGLSIAVGGVLLALGIPVVIALVSEAGDDDSESTEVDTAMLDASLIEDVLAQAVEAEGTLATEIRIDEYEIAVQYYDPNADQLRTVRHNAYDDVGEYEIAVEDNWYDSYQPRPFDVSTVSPEVLVEVGEDALDRSDDEYAFSIEVSANRQSGAVEIEATVSGDPRIEVVTDATGTVTSVQAD